MVPEDLYEARSFSVIMYDLKKHVIREFSSEKAQELYCKESEKGLWASERLLIKKYFKPKSNFLDLGCGTGRTTLELFGLGYKGIGVDIVPAMITNAKKIARKKKLSIKYRVGDAANLRFRDDSFDNALFSYNGWTQIPGKENRLRALREIHRVLKTDGHFIFTAHLRQMSGYLATWIKQWLKIYLLKPVGFKIREAEFGDIFFKYRGRDEQFIHIPSPKAVKKQLHLAGFKILLIGGSNMISPKDTQESPPVFFVCKK